jgi:hypothetical protein
MCIISYNQSSQGDFQRKIGKILREAAAPTFTMVPKDISVLTGSQARDGL